MRQVIFFLFTLLIYPSISIGEMDSKKQRDQNQVTYEEAISLSNLNDSLSNVKLVTHFPDMRDMLELGSSPNEVCENLAKKGIKCWFKGRVAFIETGFTLGELCHSIFNQKRRCLFKEPLELRILHPKKDSPYMSFFFEKLNDDVLIVKKLKSTQGQISNEQEAGTAIRFFYSPNF